MHGAGGGRPIVHGRYSKVLKRLRDRYEAALEDESLLDLRPTIAVMDIRIEDLLRRVDDGDDAVWPELREMLEARSVRTEKAWQVRLRGQQAVNAKDLTLILGRFVDILLEEVDIEAAGKVIAKIDREILIDLSNRS
jgi:hypothetical protein